MIANGTSRSSSVTTPSITTTTYGALKNSRRMVNGHIRPTSVGSGNPIRAPSARMAIGRRIVTGVGCGVRRMVGRGLVPSRGVGRRITTVAGCCAITSGLGCRAVNTTAGEVGGGRRWLGLCRWIFLLVMTFVGIRFLTTNTIRIRGVIAILIDRIIRDAGIMVAIVRRLVVALAVVIDRRAQVLPAACVVRAVLLVVAGPRCWCDSMTTRIGVETRVSRAEICLMRINQGHLPMNA